jgi:uncharacterized DUF497 family protein
MSEEFDAFDWDAANAGHILRHQVTPAEVEEAATLPHVTVPGQAVAGERRWQLFGKTAASRYVVVIFTIRRRLFRTVTAYPMNEAQRKIYAPQIG